MGKKRKVLMRSVKQAGLTFLALEGVQAAVVAGAARWAGKKLRGRNHRALRITGHALTTAAALVPIARTMRRRFA